MGTGRIFGIVAASIVVTAFTPLSQVVAAPPESAPADGTVTTLIVAYQPGSSPLDDTGQVTGSEQLGAEGGGLAPGRDIGFGFRTIELRRPVSRSDARALSVALERSPRVRFAEPDAVMTASDIEVPTPSWGLDRIDQAALPLSSSYSYDTRGTGVRAYVVDTGIRASHVDLVGRVAPGVDEVLDGNGTSDCNGHGTHVAGTIGGTAYGVAKGVTLVPVRVLGCTGSGTASGLIAGLNWVVTDHAAHPGPAVLNMSLGFGSVVSSVDTVVRSVIASGVTVAIASGNGGADQIGDDACTSSPGDVAEAITVNASTSTDTRPTWSNYGPCSDIYAPGVGITSSWGSGDTATNTISGTSMATPHVTGVAARILEANPGFQPADVWAAMSAAATAKSFSAFAGDPARLLFIGVTVAPPVGATAPSPPTSVTVAAGNARAAVSWAAPATDGGSALTGFTARAWAADAGGAAPVSTCAASSMSTTCTVTGLVGGTTYWVDAVAANAVGTGDPSSPRVPVTPITVPSSPTWVKVTAAKSSAVVSWTAPSSNGGSAITTYTARAWSRTSGGTFRSSCSTSGLTCTIVGLRSGTTVYVDVVSVNGAGTGAASSPRVSVRPV